MDLLYIILYLSIDIYILHTIWYYGSINYYFNAKNFEKKLTKIKINNTIGVFFQCSQYVYNKLHNTEEGYKF